MVHTTENITSSLGRPEPGAALVNPTWASQQGGATPTSRLFARFAKLFILNVKYGLSLRVMYQALTDRCSVCRVTQRGQLRDKLHVAEGSPAGLPLQCIENSSKQQTTHTKLKSYGNKMKNNVNRTIRTSYLVVMRHSQLSQPLAAFTAAAATHNCESVTCLTV